MGGIRSAPFFSRYLWGREWMDQREEYEMSRLTWQKLTQLEPRLLEVLKQAQAVKDDKSERSFCANRVWFGYDEPGPGPRGLKSKVSSLVGWCSVNAGHPVLGSSEAYDLAYRTVYDALPYCRDCACL